MTHTCRGSSIRVAVPPGQVPAGTSHYLTMKLVRCLVVVMVLFMGACASSRAGGAVAGAPAAPAAVERFLQLASVKDYVGMGWIFGTAGGPIMARDPAAEVEQRMYALASLLAHDGYVVGNGMAVPGRTSEAVAFDVIITQGGRNLRVPFTAVRGPSDRWFVESLDVEVLTNR